MVKLSRFNISIYIISSREYLDFGQWIGIPVCYSISLSSGQFNLDWRKEHENQQIPCELEVALQFPLFSPEN